MARAQPKLLKCPRVLTYTPPQQPAPHAASMERDAAAAFVFAHGASTTRSPHATSLHGAAGVVAGDRRSRRSLSRQGEKEIFSTIRSPNKQLTRFVRGCHSRGIGGTLLGTTGPKSSREDSEVSRVGFILDSGAAVHATGSADLLSERRAPGEGAFRTRAGKDLDVVAVGSVITPRFVVPEVRHVPVLGQGCTLISVRQLARRGLAVTFGSEFCDIRERSTGAVVGEGRLREEDGLYFLDYLRVPQS